MLPLPTVDRCLVKISQIDSSWKIKRIAFTAECLTKFKKSSQFKGCFWVVWLDDIHLTN